MSTMLYFVIGTVLFLRFKDHLNGKGIYYKNQKYMEEQRNNRKRKSESPSP